jgi:hypothetical protein
MPTKSRSVQPVERVRSYLLRIFDRVVTDRVEHRIEQRVSATLDVLTDPGLMSDLREADAQPDEDARPYDEIRRDLGLA